MLRASAELRLLTDAVDLRLQPEYARTSSDSGSGNGIGTRFALSSGRFRAGADIRHRTGTWREMMEPRFALGSLRDDFSASTEYDFPIALRAFAQWRRRSGADTAGDGVRDETALAGMQWTPAGLPSITARVERLTETTTSETRRTVLRGDLSWALPVDLLQAMHMNSMSLTGYARLADETTSLRDSSGPMRYTNLYFRIVASPRPLFTVNAYYRGDHEDARLPLPAPALSIEKLFADLAMESVQGVSLGARFTRDRMRAFHASLPRASVDDRLALQTSARFLPGTFIDGLDAFALDLNATIDRRAYSLLSDPFALFQSLFSSKTGDSATVTLARTSEARVEWRPTPLVTSITTGRYAENGTEISSLIVSDIRREALQRVDLRPGNTTLITAQVGFVSRDWSSNHDMRWSPSAWIEHRWSDILLTRATLAASFSRSEGTSERSTTSELFPTANVTLSWSDLPLLSRLELRNDVSYRDSRVRLESLQPSVVTRETMVSTLGNSFYLDIYPLPSSYIRAIFSTMWRLRGSSAMPPSTSNLTVQIVVQL